MRVNIIPINVSSGIDKVLLRSGAPQIGVAPSSTAYCDCLATKELVLDNLTIEL